MFSRCRFHTHQQMGHHDRSSQVASLDDRPTADGEANELFDGVQAIVQPQLPAGSKLDQRAQVLVQ
jgi:hypothetical protein